MKRASRFSSEQISSLIIILWLATAAVGFAKSPQTPAEELAALVQLNPQTDLNRIAESAEQLAQEARLASSEVKIFRSVPEDELANLPYTELREFFHQRSDQLSKREIRGVETVAQIARKALNSSAEIRLQHLAELSEVLAGLKNNRRPTVPETIGITTPWRLLPENSHRSIGDADLPATNHIAENFSVFPLGLWKAPQNIGQQDLYAGFGRERLPGYQQRIWNYVEPKTSSGTRPGFEIRSGSFRYKAKLAEAHSEPFTARVFDALGYYVDPTDCADELKIRYSRRLFREFNIRKPLTMRIQPLWIPLGSMNVQPSYDPFEFVKQAVFKDGRTISGTELKSQLFVNVSTAHPEEDPKNFRQEIEADLDYIVVGPVNLQPAKESAESIGCWDFVGLGHENVRELRAVGLLAAWLGWFDSRFDNTRLRLSETDRNRKLLFYFTDLGSGMGSGKGWLVRHGEDANAFEWAFTAPEIVRGPGQMTTPFRVKNFKTIVPTPAFQNMTREDARWMARLIAQLTEDQIAAALIASGYDSAEAKLYLEKLLSRRDQMLRDLDLVKEFPPLRPQGSDQKFSYIPETDEPFKAKRSSGEIVSARKSSQIVRDGKLQ